MTSPSGASPGKDAARNVVSIDIVRAIRSNLAGASEPSDTTSLTSLKGNNKCADRADCVVVRLRRQVRRGVVITPYNNVDEAGNRCRFKVYLWRLGLGPQGRVFGAPNLLLAQATAESLSRQFGVPVLDYSAGNGRLPTFDGAA